jgi:hypothetical protein
LGYNVTTQTCTLAGDHYTFPITIDPNDGNAGGTDELICRQTYEVTAADLSNGSITNQFFARPNGQVDFVESDELIIPVS